MCGAEKIPKSGTKASHAEANFLDSLRFVLGSFFRHALFSTTSFGSFLASFFPQDYVFNNFSASFLGSFRFVFGSRSCVFNNFSGSFLKKGILFVPFVSFVPKTAVVGRPPAR